MNLLGVTFAYTKTKDGKKVNVFYLYDDGECVIREYDVPFEGKARRVTDMRTGRELAFVQNGGTLTVQSDDERVGKPGDIADCFVIEV